MKNRYAALLTALCLFLVAGGWGDRHGSGGNTPHDACRSGRVRGAGYDSASGLYDWTCGNFPWSAYVGGVQAGGNGGGTLISDYTSPTTVGGNSWIMDCTGDGYATGNPTEETVCLHAGEQIRMYSMADIMLAADNVRDGGKVYLPDGLYHTAYCGQQANGTDKNGCPVLQHFNDHFQRRINMWGSRELVMESTDPDGPHKNGRTGTWILGEEGDDLDDDGTINDNVTDRNGDGWGPSSNGTIKVGGGGGAYVCRRDNGSNGCEVYPAATGPDTIPTKGFARTFSGVILADISRDDATNGGRVCLENRLTDGATDWGTCAQNRSLQCDAASGGRISVTSGDCVIDTVNYGPCEGLVTALQTDLASNEECTAADAPYDCCTGLDTGYCNGGSITENIRYLTFETYIRNTYQSDAAGNSAYGGIALAQVGSADPTAACSATGAYVYLSEKGTTNRYMYPSFQPTFDIDWQSTAVTVYDWPAFNDEGGGFRDFNLMPAHWLGRDSPNNKADCSGFGTRGADESWDSGNANARCDSMGLIHLGSGWKGHIRNMHSYYGGGKDSAGNGYAYSLVDGTNGGFYVELADSLIQWGSGLMSDPSQWYFHDNVWRGWTNNSGLLMVWGYAPGMRVERDKFFNNHGSYCFAAQHSPGTIVRDIEVSQNNCTTAMFSFLGARNFLLSGVTGYGNRGRAFVIDPKDTDHVWDVVIEKVNLEAHAVLHGTAKGYSLIQRYDGNKTAAYDAGEIKNVKFEDIAISVDADQDICAILLEGGNGSEAIDGAITAAENGLGRKVHLDRHELTFENIHIAAVANGAVTGSIKAFCLGNDVADMNDPTDADVYEIWESKSGLPAWTNVSVGGTRIPDNPYRSYDAADVPDCQTLTYGTVVRIRDDATAAQTCADALSDGILDGGGTYNSLCRCDPAGDAGDGSWTGAF